MMTTIVAEAAPRSFGRRFWPLFALGMIGIAALPLVIVPLIEARVRAGAAPGVPLAVLTALALIQPILLLAAGTAVGAALAERTGFTSHLAGINVRSRFARELPLAIASGFVAGIVIVALDAWLYHALANAGMPSARTLAAGLVGGALYGGLTEEIMTRFGLLSLVVWAGARLVSRGDTSSRGVVVAAIVIVALLFAAGHLPAAAAMTPLTPSVVSRILILNVIAGLVFGWLYWRRSLESAMVAHATVHVVFAMTGALTP